MTPLVAIRQFDQSLWLDFISRPILINGKLQHRIAEEALRGVTSNPAIFAKSIGDSTDYDSAIQALALQGKTTDEIYTNLAVADVQAACDLFRPLYDSADNSSDGYVSLEVSPTLVNDTEGTIEEGLRLWQSREPPQRDDKSAGHPGRPARHPPPHCRRHERERDADFWPGALPPGAEAFLSGLEDRAKSRLAAGAHRLGGQLLPQPHRRAD